MTFCWIDAAESNCRHVSVARDRKRRGTFRRSLNERNEQQMQLYCRQTSIFSRLVSRRESTFYVSTRSLGPKREKWTGISRHFTTAPYDTPAPVKQTANPPWSIDECKHTHTHTHTGWLSWTLKFVYHQNRTLTAWFRESVDFNWPLFHCWRTLRTSAGICINYVFQLATRVARNSTI